MSDVVVLLPGILGSVLQRDGKDVWAFTPGAAGKALLSLGGSIRDLRLEDDPPDVDDLGDGVTAPRLMSDVHLIPGLWKIDGYSKIAAAIEASFEVERGSNYFDFPYDWRRDNRVAARRLARQSHDWLAAWRQRSGNDKAKLILIGHSMGGLVARHFLECLDGWTSTRMLITFGTPYRGSLNALEFIVHGMKKRVGPLKLIDLSDLLRSFTSVYQLLPVYPCIDTGADRMQRVLEVAGLPELDVDRATSARDFHQDIRAAVDEHLKDDRYLEGRYSIHPIVGMFQPTLQSARFVDGKVTVLREYGGDDQDGDGTVPRVSATPIELSKDKREMFTADRHATLQNADPVLNQLAGLLSGTAIDLSTYFAFGETRLSLDIEDVYATDEPITVLVRAETEGVVLHATISNAADGTIVSRFGLVEGDDGRHHAEAAPMAAGTYRLSVDGEPSVDPVSDVFAVL
jgi:pimeloyl-ACP methyl ester carboxylesterase